MTFQVLTQITNVTDR